MKVLGLKDFHKYSIILFVLSCSLANAQPAIPGYIVDYDTTTILKNIRVVSRKGATLRQEPQKEADSLRSYPYGTRLDVIAELKDWWGIRERITRTYIVNEKTIERTAWEKVYVSKSEADSSVLIQLIPDDLRTITLLTQHEETTYSEETGTELEGILELELVTPSNYERAKKNRISYFVGDSLKYKKVKGIITLPCKNKTIRFKDRPDEEETIAIYTYVGQIPIWNVYAVLGMYWEDYDCQLIDKTTGVTKASLGNIPYIAPDKKHFIDLNANAYELTGDVSIGMLNKGKIEALNTISFKNWMPVGKYADVFWTKEGYLYFPVLHVNAYWKDNGDLNEQREYMRLRLIP